MGGVAGVNAKIAVGSSRFCRLFLVFGGALCLRVGMGVE